MSVTVGHERPYHLAARPGDLATCEECGQPAWMADEERIWLPTSSVCYFDRLPRKIKGEHLARLKTSLNDG